MKDARMTKPAAPHRLSARLALAIAVLAATGARAESPAPAPQAPAAQPSPEELLQSSDRARGGIQGGITWTVTVDSVEDGEKSSRAAIVKARQVDALVEMTAPAREKGQLLLFNDRNLWFIKPGLRKPVAVSSRQKLSGQAANGDIASTNYARDYKGTIVREEKVGDDDAYVLELKAVAPNVTYDRIRYWISKSRQLGLKAEFLTLQGDVFKSATFEYGNKLQSGKVLFPFVSRMIITDAAFPENVTTLTYGPPKQENHPASLFNINNVVR